MNLKKIAPWVGIAFVVFFITTSPGAAADLVGSLIGTVGDIANGFGTFLSELFS